jgi:hypothetical protein
VPTSPSCAQCNRAFCLSLNLTICQGIPTDAPPATANADVQALCFQRDSRKDEIIVWGFIVGTAGLLGWAGLRRVLESRAVKTRIGGGGLGGVGAQGGPAGGLGSRIGELAAGLRGAAGGGGDDGARGAYQTVGGR